EKPAASDTDIPENLPVEEQETEITDVSDFDYISEKGKIVIGYTDYAPMNYTDDEGEFTGFDTELAIAVCEKLGLTPEFVEINWDTKEIELEAKSIDCIWNGLTITPSRQDAMSISDPYVKNAQVVIVKKGSGISGTADLIDKTVVAEVSSAGEMQILGDDENEPEENLAQAKYVAVNYQKDCLLEVKSGTADAAVLDWTLAMTMIGEGTSYDDLEMIEGLELATEEYGIAFRKGSDITEKVNAALRELVEDGTLPALAEKYGLSLAPTIS
ncbi:MAG: transporter substrate-binding domain-containing protein, partial [Clostridiales bacterium]|nr:transporter substrate-binding domain-containing protein [Clostridiales bacterium]